MTDYVSQFSPSISKEYFAMFQDKLRQFWFKFELLSVFWR